jgi:motility quorum-sensing regulator / GCU-specific mRNA interferase toxin
MEKKRPTYDLASLQAAFATTKTLRMTKTAHDAALAMGYALQDVVDLIQRLNRTHFYKSMTSRADHRLWQDVYHLPDGARVLYLKFTTDGTGRLLISFKAKEDLP